MPPSQYTRTLGQLLLTYRLYAGCAACRRAVELDVGVLIRRYGEQAPVDDMKQRVRCRQCGKRTHDVRIVRLGRRGWDKDRH